MTELNRLPKRIFRSGVSQVESSRQHEEHGKTVIDWFSSSPTVDKQVNHAIHKTTEMLTDIRFTGIFLSPNQHIG
jgi:hypothetical protein